MARCEDFPCCGHTDSLGCDYTPDYEYINAHIWCEHEAGYCVLQERDEDADPEFCEHGDYSMWRGRYECDLCGSELVMVTDQHERVITSSVIPGFKYSITVLGIHMEVAA